MAVTDSIADLLTRIRNASKAKHKYLDIRSSKKLLSIVTTLEKLGFIEGHLIDAKDQKLRIFLKYGSGRHSVIQGLKRISKPGLRKYVGYRDIPHVLGGMGATILSTPKGIIDGQTARQEKVGGEILCYVW